VNSVRPAWLLLVAVGTAVIGWFAQYLAVRAGLTSPVLHWTSLVTMAAIGAVTLYFGVRVLRWRRGNRTRRLEPSLARGTLILAQSSAYAGALIAGWHLGILLDQLVLWGRMSVHGTALSALGLMLAAVVLMVIGLVVERFCRVPPEDGDVPEEQEDFGIEGENGYA
jgi:hypothetical protein